MALPTRASNDALRPAPRVVVVRLFDFNHKQPLCTVGPTPYTKRTKRRFFGSFFSGGSAHQPRAPTMPRAYTEGALQSFATGALFGVGAALFLDDDTRRGAKRIVGSATVALSFYSWYHSGFVSTTGAGRPRGRPAARLSRLGLSSYATRIGRRRLVIAPKQAVGTTPSPHGSKPHWRRAAKPHRRKRERKRGRKRRSAEASAKRALRRMIPPPSGATRGVTRGAVGSTIVRATGFA